MTSSSSKLSITGFSRNLLNFIQYADGKKDILEISKLIKLNYQDTLKIHNILIKNKLII